MDSQGRSRFIVGGLALAAVLLVISLLLTEQSNRLPLVVESPLSDSVSLLGNSDSPLSAPGFVPGPDSPLAGTGASGEMSAGQVVTAESAAVVTVTTPLTSAAISTVTVSFVYAPPPMRYGFAVVASYPHDPSAYTQGLQYVDGVLYEGTGLYGRSSLRRVDLESGVVEQQIDLAPEYFGEGIQVVGDRIYQLTWKSNVAFLYDRESFELLDQFTYPTEGWGLTYDGEHLIMSDGTSTIFLRDPETFEEVGRFTVLDGDAPVNMLNELEYVQGSIWANIWLTDEIVIIDPESGKVIGRVDLAGLLPSEDVANAEVLNGIAYDEERDRLFVTGKLWPTLFEIELVPRD